MSKTPTLVLLALLVLGAPQLRAQDDVEMLGRAYGTRPPAAYFLTKVREPRAFEARAGLRAGGTVTAMSLGAPGAASPAAVFAPKSVSGSYRFPMILGLFSDSPTVPPFSAGALQRQFFDGPNPTGTIGDLYREMSGGRVILSGEAMEWRRASLTQAQVAGGVSGLSGPPSARVGQFIVEVLAQISDVDWGRFDNDGPDGMPNSGDDDGYVDILLVVHPTKGAECGGIDSTNRIWSHQWSLVDPITRRGGALGQDYVTASPSARGDRIRINNYTIQPASSCTDGRINEIGVVAHELGHGFGLPDLYASGHAGTGRWDLMGGGPYGCSSTFEPERPCPMGAWSKAVLGWVNVVSVPFGVDLGSVALDPVETVRSVYSIPSGDGSGTYYLLENRQRIGYDASIPSPGLLVWQIDPSWINAQIGNNAVNDVASHMGVWLRQADGLNQLQLSGGNRGDAGDPFPGSSGNTVFHAASNPASLAYGGAATGVALTDIALDGTRVTFRAIARLCDIRVQSSGNGEVGSLFTVDGVARPGVSWVFRSAPYQKHTIEAVAGASLGEGIRRGFSGWSDLPGGSRIRNWTTGLTDANLIAVYGGPREMRFSATVEGARFGVNPGKIVSVPASADLWFAEGTMAALTAQATTGFEFRGWKGALAGQPNPVVVLMDQPRDATATFEMVFGLEPNQTVPVPATVAQHLALTAKSANLPVTWTIETGKIPEGLALIPDGTLVGAAIESGSFPLTVRIQDALGLRATGQLTIAVSAPPFTASAIAAPFLLQPDGLTVDEKLYLDRAGNGNGTYDLGDLRSYVLAHPDVAR